MKIGDLVRDEFGNVGVVIDTARFGNGPAVHVKFNPSADNRGYTNNEGWIMERLLEVISEGA